MKKKEKFNTWNIFVLFVFCMAETLIQMWLKVKGYKRYSSPEQVMSELWVLPIIPGQPHIRKG